LKNILLVMSSSGYLVPPSVDPTHEKLWVETWKRLSRFLPDLRKELDLDSIEKPATEQPQDEASHPPVAPVS
jgi:golgi-specific brefeldin A-resistance guanine nucleotide exchange factor 1